MLAGDLGRRTGRSDSYPRSSLGVPRQVLTHGTLKLTFRGGQFFGTHPLLMRFGIRLVRCALPTRFLTPPIARYDHSITHACHYGQWRVKSRAISRDLARSRAVHNMLSHTAPCYLVGHGSRGFP